MFIFVGYKEWNVWSPCTVTCGDGERRRERRKINPEPSRCPEPLEETQSCNVESCPTNGKNRYKKYYHNSD